MVDLSAWILAGLVASIDYVFLVPGVDVQGQVRGSRVVLDTPHRLADGSPLWPSDHYGVLTELALRDPTPASH
jgi:hypothetical protein